MANTFKAGGGFNDGFYGFSVDVTLFTRIKNFLPLEAEEEVVGGEGAPRLVLLRCRRRHLGLGVDVVWNYIHVVHGQSHFYAVFSVDF